MIFYSWRDRCWNYLIVLLSVVHILSRSLFLIKLITFCFLRILSTFENGEQLSNIWHRSFSRWDLRCRLLNYIQRLIRQLTFIIFSESIFGKQLLPISVTSRYFGNVVFALFIQRHIFASALNIHIVSFFLDLFDHLS